MGQRSPLLIAFAPGRHAAGILRRELAEPAIYHWGANSSCCEIDPPELSSVLLISAAGSDKGTSSGLLTIRANGILAHDLQAHDHD
jgi:hypothetical protein